MKQRKNVISVFAMLLVLGLVLTFAKPVKAAGVSLKANKTYTKYDITGDGVKDKIRIKTSLSKTEDDVYTNLSVVINGKTAYTLKNTSFFNCIAKIHTLGNGQPFLYLRVVAENDDGPLCALLKYTGGKLKTALDFKDILEGYGSHQLGDVTSVKGNKIVITESIVSYSLGINAINFTYKYVNGKFVPASKYGSYKSIYASGKNQKYFTVNKKLPVYAKLGATKVLKTLETGVLVRIEKCAVLNGKMYIQISGNGGTYWIKALATSPVSEGEQQFMEVTYAG